VSELMMRLRAVQERARYIDSAADLVEDLERFLEAPLMEQRDSEIVAQGGIIRARLEQLAQFALRAREVASRDQHGSESACGHVVVAIRQERALEAGRCIVEATCPVVEIAQRDPDQRVVGVRLRKRLEAGELFPLVRSRSRHEPCFLLTIEI